MRAAVLAPMPGRLSSSPAAAVLMLIGDVSAGLAVERDEVRAGGCGAPVCAETRGAPTSSAVTATNESTVRNMEPPCARVCRAPIPRDDVGAPAVTLLVEVRPHGVTSSRRGWSASFQEEGRMLENEASRQLIDRVGEFGDR